MRASADSFSSTKLPDRFWGPNSGTESTDRLWGPNSGTDSPLLAVKRPDFGNDGPPPPIASSRTSRTKHPLLPTCSLPHLTLQVTSVTTFCQTIRLSSVSNRRGPPSIPEQFMLYSLSVKRPSYRVFFTYFGFIVSFIFPN